MWIKPNTNKSKLRWLKEIKNALINFKKEKASGKILPISDKNKFTRL